MQVEFAKIKLRPYSEQQFERYNSLWMSLCDLRSSVDQLWMDASERDLSVFMRRLSATRKDMEKSALLIEPRHYDELKTILDEFENYRLGKEKLIDLRRRHLPNGFMDINGEIPNLIRENVNLKRRLEHFLPEIRDCLRKQINGTDIGV